MIAALWGWAASSWSVIQARAITSGLTGPAPRPARVIDLELVHVLSLVEGILCENEDNAKRMQTLYERHKPSPPIRRGAARKAEIGRFLAL